MSNREIGVLVQIQLTSLKIVKDMEYNIIMGENMCSYDEAFTIAEMLEETGLCKKCKLSCPNAGKTMTDEMSSKSNRLDMHLS